MKLPEDRRDEFKKVMGKLFENLEDALNYLESLDYKHIVTVGDVVSADFLRNDLEPDIIIADFKTERSPAKEKDVKIIKEYTASTTKVRNPAGQITEELWKSIEEAEPPAKIIVDGEEDMATIPAAILIPETSVVVYGQPGEGLVVVEITKEKRKEFKELLDILEEN